jgi:hypothetical protein
LSAERVRSSACAYPLAITLALFLSQLQAIYKCNFKSANLQVQFKTAITSFAQPQGKCLLLFKKYFTQSGHTGLQGTKELTNKN